MLEEKDSLSVKFGIDAIFEAHEGSGLLKDLLPELDVLALDKKANIRASNDHLL